MWAIFLISLPPGVDIFRASALQQGFSLVPLVHLAQFGCQVVDIDACYQMATAVEITQTIIE